jgi:hypothetical protein
MAHRVFSFVAYSVALVTDEGNDHAVQIEEEHEKVESQLDERLLKSHTQELAGGSRGRCAPNRPKGVAAYLLVHIQLAEDLGRVQQVLVVVDPLGAENPRVSLARRKWHGSSWSTEGNLLLRIEGQKRQVQENCEPVSIDDE